MADRVALLLELTDELNKYSRSIVKWGQQAVDAMHALKRIVKIINILCIFLFALCVYRIIVPDKNLLCQQMMTVCTITVALFGSVSVLIGLLASQLYRHVKFGTLEEETPPFWFLVSFAVTLPATATVDMNISAISFTKRRLQIYLREIQRVLAIVLVGTVFSVFPILPHLVESETCEYWKSRALFL